MTTRTGDRFDHTPTNPIPNQGGQGAGRGRVFVGGTWGMV